MKPRKCYGPDAARATHAPGCRPSRPCCRFRRRAYTCGCDAYPFPHRRWGGACGEVAQDWISKFNRREADRVAGVLRSLGSTPNGRTWILPPELSTAAPSAEEVRRRATEARAMGGAPLAALVSFSGGGA